MGSFQGNAETVVVEFPGRNKIFSKSGEVETVVEGDCRFCFGVGKIYRTGLVAGDAVIVGDGDGVFRDIVHCGKVGFIVDNVAVCTGVDDEGVVDVGRGSVAVNRCRSGVSRVIPGDVHGEHGEGMVGL